MVECEYTQVMNKLLSKLGFNRYMVECESNKLGIGADAYSVLIDTWWNVNSLRLISDVMCSQVLIDTWWNVN